MKATKEQIAQWKKKHGKVYKIEVDGKRCYLKKPSRQATSLHMYHVSQDNLMKAYEVLLENCWLEGDEEIKTDTDLFLSVKPRFQNLYELKKAVARYCKSKQKKNRHKLDWLSGCTNEILSAHRSGQIK